MVTHVPMNEIISFSIEKKQIKKQKFIKIFGEVISIPDDAVSALKGSVKHKKPFREIIKETRAE